MAQVPQKTLDWLYRVLTSGYRDPNRAYDHVVHLLARYPNFAPRTDVYTYEDGAAALLLNLSGTLPVSFRGVTYRFPITVWIPATYPGDPPFVYVTPTQDMVVRPGQHVSGEGRVYHHYLAHWAEGSNRSTLVDFLYILRDVFAKEPPVASKQAVIGRLAPPQAHHTPPAIPPLPPQLTRPELPPKPSPPSLQNPPQLPPKPGKTIEAQDRREPPIPEKYKEPLPLPPLRNGFRAPRQQLFQHPSQASQPLNGPDIHLPRGQPSTSNVYTIPNQHQQGPMPPYQRYPQERPDSVSPITQTGPPLPLPPQSLNYGPSQPIQYAQPVPIHPHVASPQSQPTPQYGYYSRPLQPSHPIPVQQEPMRPKQPTPDLLTSPFDLELPSQPQTAAPPPIPPNPEKDFLLQTLSRTLTQTLHDSVDKANFALQPLNSQSQSIHAAIATLKSEISALNSFHATLQSNTSILQQSLQRADSVIADAHARLSSSSTSSSTPTPGPSTTITSTTDQPPPGLPAIDEVLVPPTVVGKQIYDLVADERGIERAMYALQTGLVKGRVGLDTWAKLTRGLAREAFLKKALIRKAGVGMGLNV